MSSMGLVLPPICLPPGSLPWQRGEKMRVCVCVCVLCVCVCVRVCVCVCVCVRVPRMHARDDSCTDMRVFVCLCVYVFVCVSE
jgi:hypothetical protein